ncbi:MAG: ATP-binding protein [Anaerolineales bacterium]|jgi:two-component system NtrC family sensor kinase|nr:ATP-binding protein [Anaerolineales bacterium]
MAKADLILLAMDTSPTLGLLERALRASGYDVALAHNVDGLNRLLLETSPVVLLISQAFDGQDGIEIAQQALERFPTLPVLLYADQEDNALFKKAIRAGISDFMHPPLRIDDIVNIVKHNQKRAERMGDWVRREVRRTTASLEKRMDEMETLVKLGRTINSSLDLDNVLTSVVTAAVELTGAEEGQLLLLDEKTNELYMRAGRNFEEEFARTFRLPIRDSIAGQVVHSGKPVSFCQDSPSKIKTAYLVYALIYVPLCVGERVVGVLGVDNRQNKRPFSQHHELLMSVLADYAVIAIENAQAFQSTDQERQKLDATINNIQDGVILLDADKKILLINPAARKVFGLGLSDLTGQAVLKVIPDGDFAGIMDSISENPLNHHEMAFDDGRVFNAQYVPLPEIGSVITFEEITHLKMLDRLKSDFIHTISHDLRSPLTAIMGYVELLDRVGPLNDQQKQFVRHVQNSAQNITSLINDLLDLGRIEAGFDTRKDEVAFDSILGYTLENLNQQIIEKEQTLKLSIEEKLPALRGNPIRLRQLVDNLLVNAVKYTPNGGTLTVNLFQDTDQVILEVIDTGVGIPVADQPHVFEKFYRAGNTPKNTPGTGLGLAIVKSIVENHDGRIWLESTVGKGSKFVVVLPIYKTPDD